MSTKERIQQIADLLERFPNTITNISDLHCNYYITLNFNKHTFEEKKNDHFNLIRIAKFLVDEFNKHCEYEFPESQTNFKISVAWNYFSEAHIPLIYLRFNEQDIDNIIMVLTKLTDSNNLVFKSFIENDMFLY